MIFYRFVPFSSQMGVLFLRHPVFGNPAHGERKKENNVAIRHFFVLFIDKRYTGCFRKKSNPIVI